MSIPEKPGWYCARNTDERLRELKGAWVVVNVYECRQSECGLAVACAGWWGENGIDLLYAADDLKIEWGREINPEPVRSSGQSHLVDYGTFCGRHWMSIGGKTLGQFPGADVHMADGEVIRLAKGTIGAPEWSDPLPLGDLVGVKQWH